MDDEIDYDMDHLLKEIDEMVFSSEEEKAAFTKVYTRYYKDEVYLWISGDPWPMGPKNWRKCALEGRLTDEDKADINDTVFSSSEEKIKCTQAYVIFLDDFGPWELTEGYPPMPFKEWKKWWGKKWVLKLQTWEDE